MKVILMNNYNFLVAKCAAKIVVQHDKRKELERQIGAIYKEAREAGVNRLDLKTAVQNYHIADAGVVPEDTKSDDNDKDMERHLAIIDRALAKFRERRE
jgi:hypothetical protein